MLKFACFALLAAVVVADPIHFTDCGHHEVVKLDVSQCPKDADVCTIHKGKALKFEAEVLANQDSKKMNVKLIATVDGLSIPIPGAERDGCKYIKCPIVKGQTYDFQYNLTVPKLLPDIKAEVTAQLEGDMGLLACVKVKGEIKD